MGSLVVLHVVAVPLLHHVAEVALAHVGQLLEPAFAVVRVYVLDTEHGVPVAVQVQRLGLGEEAGALAAALEYGVAVVPSLADDCVDVVALGYDRDEVVPHAGEFVGEALHGRDGVPRKDHLAFLPVLTKRPSLPLGGDDFAFLVLGFLLSAVFGAFLALCDALGASDVSEVL